MKKKRFTALLMVCALVLSMFACPIVPFAKTTSGETGDCTWKLNGTVLTISGKGQMENYSYHYNDTDSTPWGTNVTKVIIDEGVTNIGDYAFYRCKELKSVKLPSTVERIGDSAFLWCSSLEKISLPSGLKNLEEYSFGNTGIKSIVIPSGISTINSGTFRSCSNLSSVTIPSSVETIGSSAFSGCSSLSNIEIPSSVKVINSSAFSGCISLTSITLPSNLTELSWHTFSSCENLKNINFNNRLKKIDGYVFYGCENLKSITIPASVTTIEDFAFCGNNFESINVEKNNKYFTSIDGVLFSKDGKTLIKYPMTKEGDYTMPSQVTDIKSGAFEDCSNIKSVTISPNVTTLVYDAFNGCESLVNINIPASVKTIVNKGNADSPSTCFNCCRNLKSINVDVNNPYYSSIDGVLYSKDKTILYRYPEAKEATSFTIPSSVKTIERSAFINCKKITELIIPSSVTKICDFAFSMCGSDKLKMTFLGSPPEFGIDALGWYDLEIYYPKDKGWVTDKYENDSIVWHEYTIDNTTRIFGKAKAAQPRTSGDSRYDTSINIADQLKKALNVDKFDTVIVAYGRNYADALAGSYLAALAKAPILIVNTDENNKNDYSSMAKISNYIDKNLLSGGTVYVLGGTAVISDEYLNTLAKDGRDVIRLAGENRYETNIKILKECLKFDPNPTEVLVCDAYNYADSLSCSSLGKPILLIDKQGQKLTNMQISYLKSLKLDKAYIIGGEAAVPNAIQKAIKSYASAERIFGSNRYETSVKIAQKFLGAQKAAVIAYGHDFPDGLCGGTIANALNAPLVLVYNDSGAKNTNLSFAKDYFSKNSIKRFVILGGTNAVTEKTKSILK